MADDVFGIVGTVQGGAFRVEAVVAEGGFAVVYRAFHPTFRSDIALKCLKVPRSLSDDEKAEFLEKFREEAELLFRLSSAIPNVVRPLHVGTLATKDGRFAPFLALEWLEGETLDQLVTARALEGKPPLDVRQVVKLLTPIAEALHRAHHFPGSDGVVSILHRDLKPENVFIARVHGREIAKVLDFGIAKVKSAATQMVGQKSATESPLAAFTPAYGAPEQWLPKRYGQTGPWTDVWGLALTVVEAVCGHTPVDGDHAAMMGTVIDPARRPTPRNEGVKVPDDVEAVFVRALAVDPKDRFQGVSPFWNALTRAVGLAETEVAPRAAVEKSAIPELAPPVSSKSRVAPLAGKPRAAQAPRAAPLRIEEPVPLAPLSRAVPVRTSAFRPQGTLDLARPIRLLFVAVVLMGGDFAYTNFTGEVLRLGPARMLWLAGPLAVLGVIQILVRLLAVSG